MRISPCFGSAGLVLSLLLATACMTPGESNGHKMGQGLAVLEGDAAYRQRIALPADAVLVVKIEDVSLADAPAAPIAENRIETRGRQVPLAFSVQYDPARIEQGRRYAVRAQIFGGGGELMWTTDTYTPLPERGSGRLMLNLVQVTRAGG